MSHINKKNKMVSFLVFVLACFAGVATAQEPTNFPASYKDDLYHCRDPTKEKNTIPCDPSTFRWKLDALRPDIKPDDSLVCQEVTKILVRAKEEEELATGQSQTEEDVALWETIMESSVVDALEPCVLWAMSYGPLAPWAESMGFVGLVSDQPQHHADINDNSGELWNSKDNCDFSGTRSTIWCSLLLFWSFRAQTPSRMSMTLPSTPSSLPSPGIPSYRSPCLSTGPSSTT
jgi:hypothetical protein